MKAIHFAVATLVLDVLCFPLADAQVTDGNQQIQQEQAQNQGVAPSLNPVRVRQIQQALKDSGYNAGNMDGQWDRDTAAGMRNFQQAQGIESTGIPTVRSLQALGLGSKTQDVAGDTGNAGVGTGADQQNTREE